MIFAFEVLKAQWRYRLVAPYCYPTDILGEQCGNQWVHLDPDGSLSIAAGYAWDGPSGPTLDTPDTMRASLVHDALYQLMGNSELHRDNRRKADDCFRQILITDRMPGLRVWYYFLAVRLFGGIALWLTDRSNRG